MCIISCGNRVGQRMIAHLQVFGGLELDQLLETVSRLECSDHLFEQSE